jgi:hypothetical protein
MWSTRYSCQILMKKDRLKIKLISGFMRIPPVWAEFCAGGRTDMMKLIIAFLNFANATEKVLPDLRSSTSYSIKRHRSRKATTLMSDCLRRWLFSGGIDGSLGLRSAHARLFGNRRQPKRGACNNSRFARGRSLCEGKSARKFKANRCLCIS